MSYELVTNLGGAGIVPEAQRYGSASHVWLDGNNIRFKNGFVTQINGEENVYGTPSVAPWFLLQMITGTQVWWVYAGATKIYSIFTPTELHTDRSTLTYGATDTLRWNGGLLGGIPVLNNGVDQPQSTNSTAMGNFNSLTNWDSNIRCKAMRPFRNYLLALNTTESSVDYPFTVRWSAAATPGAVPPSWNEADDNYDAGTFELKDTNGYVVDSLPMRTINVVYKEDSCYSMQWVGGQSVFAFQRMFDSVGMLSQQCAAEVDGRHVVLTSDDVVLHDGVTVNSIIDKKWRKFLFQRLNGDEKHKSFIVRNLRQSEIWICFVEIDNTWCNKALVWNFRDNTWSIHDLPGIAHAAPGLVPGPNLAGTWDADTNTWDSDLSVFDDSGYGITRQRMLMADPTNTKTPQGDVDHIIKTGFVRREGLFFSPAVRHLEELRFVTNSTAKFKVRVGSEMELNQGVIWKAAQTFTAATDRKLDVRVTGRAFAIELEFDDNTKISEVSEVVWKFADVVARR